MKKKLSFLLGSLLLIYGFVTLFRPAIVVSNHSDKTLLFYTNKSTMSKSEEHLTYSDVISETRYPMVINTAKAGRIKFSLWSSPDVFYGGLYIVDGDDKNEIAIKNFKMARDKLDFCRLEVNVYNQDDVRIEKKTNCLGF